MPVTLIKSLWSSGNLHFRQTVATGDASINFGQDDVGIDVNFYGATSTKVMIWDQSGDGLVMSGADLNFTGTRGAAGLFDIDGSATYFADFAAAGAGGISLTADGMSQDPDTASEDGFLTILVGASIYEIPMWLNT